MNRDPEAERRERRRQETSEAFHRLCLNRMSVTRYATRGAGQWVGGELPVFRALHEAWWALREQRMAHNYRLDYQDEVSLAIRVVAETLAGEIAGAAGPEQDAGTLAWVVAGLRCPSRPFCTGCRACFTVTAPNRPVTGEVGIDTHA